MEPSPKLQKTSSGAKAISVSVAVSEAPYDRYIKSALENECKLREVSSKGTRDELEKRLKVEDTKFGAQRALQKLEKDPVHATAVQDRDKFRKERDELIARLQAVNGVQTTRQSPITRQSPTSAVNTGVKTAQTDLGNQGGRRFQTKSGIVIPEFEVRFVKYLDILNNIVEKAKTIPAVRKTAKPNARSNAGDSSSSSNWGSDGEEEPDWSEDGVDQEDKGPGDDAPGENPPLYPSQTVLTIDHRGQIEMYVGARSQVTVTSGSKGHETDIGTTGGHRTRISAKVAPTSVFVSIPFTPEHGDLSPTGNSNVVAKASSQNAQKIRLKR
ncbi:hypothetical protein MMC14_007887 [Varicellaria rhodocarpa]|nr:hypothetical protein [Varicellaria rhodocarpa]